MHVALLEPYYGGSHRRWVAGYQQHTEHRLTLLTLPAQAWKWRMQGGAVTLARQFNTLETVPDVVLASDMLDLTTFRALTRHRTQNTPVALYFHENQLTYPQNSRQNHGYRYGFINYISALAADVVYFNSQYHLEVFFEYLPRMLNHFYDYPELESIAPLRARAAVLPVGVELDRYDAHRTAPSGERPPLILWNHRWEEDKNPAAFFRALDGLVEMGIDFRVAIVGENVRHSATEFEAARERLGERVVAFGYQASFTDYARLLWEADYVVSTAKQEFFGIAVAEAIYCQCVPILPERLNYPHLLPASAHHACLYPQDGALREHLARHLRGELPVNTAALREHIARYNWATVAPAYDAALSRLAQRPRPPLAC